MISPKGRSSEMKVAYRCGDRVQLLEAVRVDGADVPGGPDGGGGVRRGDPRSHE